MTTTATATIQDVPTPSGSRRPWNRETADCPSDRHSHTRRGYLEYGCRCPSTIAAYEYALQQRRDCQRRYAHGETSSDYPGHRPAAEIDDCPAVRHRHSEVGYQRDGCRCPSTVKAHDRTLETHRAATRRWAQRELDSRKLPKIDLRKANRTDAEAIAFGYLTGKVDKHTRALAVRLMLEAEPQISDTQISWRLAATGQGRHETRTVSRIVASIQHRRRKAGAGVLPRPGQHTRQEG